MTVYVDDMHAKHGWLVMSHMVADTSDELHAMALRIGLKLKWYQGDHYDLAASKRLLAIQHGAVPITWQQCGMMVANRRATGFLGEPETAAAIFCERLRANSRKISEVVT